MCLKTLIWFNYYVLLFFHVLSQSQKGQKRYQVNLRSHSTPIHVLLINRETCSSRPVVFSVPPPDDICAMPTPPSTPANLQKYPITTESCGLEHSQLKSPAPDAQLTPLSTPPDFHMGIINSLMHSISGLEENYII